MVIRTRLVVALAMLAAVGCATHPPVGRADLLEFLHDGTTSRADVILKLGPPNRTFENNRIASWRLAKDEAGYFLVAPTPTGWYGARYELVVVFTANDVMEQHSLVEIRAP